MVEGVARLDHDGMEANNIVVLCAVPSRCFPAGANPARQLSLRSDATGAVVAD